MTAHGDRAAAHELISGEATAALDAIVAAGYLPDLLRPDFAGDRTQVEQFYASARNSLVWVRDSQPTPQAQALIGVFQNAAIQGLLPEDYDGPRWNARLSMLYRSPRSGADLARFDVALTVSAMRYVSNRYWGRASPIRLQDRPAKGPSNFDFAPFLLRLAVATDVNATLEQLDAPFPAYQSTIRALERYSKLAAESAGEPLPAPAQSVRPGRSYDGLPRLVHRLRLLGDLSTNASVPEAEGIYTGELVQAVKRFQGRHGLEPDGVIGPLTLNALNTPLTHRVLQLQLALERWRWLPREFVRPPIIVNVPEFGLRAYDQQLHPALSMKVVVGRAYKHQTPMFSSEMKYVIFRPPWNVPLSIQIKEMVPAIAKDPEYLLKGNYEITDRYGNVVSDGHVNPLILSELRSGKLALRQRPGPDNSLGLVKFVIPNDHDVYLHGTPAMSLFSQSRRDFSHGCIRVEDPLALALWVLQDQPEWTAESMRAAVNGDKTVSVNVRQPIPVFVVYTTAVAEETGAVRFFEDIYKQDAALAKELAQRHSAE
jgi:L,D-transpeptidase YcbB